MRLSFARLSLAAALLVLPGCGEARTAAVKCHPSAQPALVGTLPDSAKAAPAASTGSAWAAVRGASADSSGAGVAAGPLCDT
ncbi:MAG TPA: hypothetical protein VHG91_04570 [Longimicrobium sp.]|nr:hypothetical protein [Longimicrobium sp.]